MYVFEQASFSLAEINKFTRPAVSSGMSVGSFPEQRLVIEPIFPRDLVSQRTIYLASFPVLCRNENLFVWTSGFPTNLEEHEFVVDRRKEALLKLSKESHTVMGDVEDKKVYVGNLSYGTTDETLRDHFASIGGIEEGKLRSYAFSTATFSLKFSHYLKVKLIL